MNWWLIPVGFLSGICASMGIGGGFVLMLYLTLFADFAQKDAQFSFQSPRSPCSNIKKADSSMEMPPKALSGLALLARGSVRSAPSGCQMNGFPGFLLF